MPKSAVETKSKPSSWLSCLKLIIFVFIIFVFVFLFSLRFCMGRQSCLKLIISEVEVAKSIPILTHGYVLPISYPWKIIALPAE